MVAAPGGAPRLAGGGPRPAKAKTPPSLSWMCMAWRCLGASARHSKKPVAGIKQRPVASASRNIGLDASDSARALIGGGFLFGLAPSLSQNGFKPHVAV